MKYKFWNKNVQIIVAPNISCFCQEKHIFRIRLHRLSTPKQTTWMIHPWFSFIYLPDRLNTIKNDVDPRALLIKLIGRGCYYLYHSRSLVDFICLPCRAV